MIRIPETTGRQQHFEAGAAFRSDVPVLGIITLYQERLTGGTRPDAIRLIRHPDLRHTADPGDADSATGPQPPDV